MPYDDLHQLIGQSSSARRYFLSLPTDTQLALHDHNPYIHTAADLHARAAAVTAYKRQVAISEFYDP